MGRALLAEGAQLESRDARGDTPLLTAMYLREWGVVAWLLGGWGGGGVVCGGVTWRWVEEFGG